MKWREVWLYSCGVTAGGHIFTKMIKEDLSVIEKDEEKGMALQRFGAE